MLEQIKDLNNKITAICDYYVINNRPSIIEDAKKIMPDIQKIATWFIEEPDIGVTPEQKAYMNSEVVGMLRDMMDAIERKDSVLMLDALDCGIAEYLRLFIPEEDFDDEG